MRPPAFRASLEGDGIERALAAAALVAAIAVLPARADVTAPTGRDLAAPSPVIPCTCRFQGRDFELGQKACIRGRTARCDRVLNNTSWTISQAPCPISALTTPRRAQ